MTMTRVDRLGRVVISRGIRHALEIEEGDLLEINVNTKAEQIIIKKISNTKRNKKNFKYSNGRPFES